MKALLLRVGIDKGSGGCLGPIFDDGSFEYIPIPEKCDTLENTIYANLFGRNYKILAGFVPIKLHNSTPHIDPEFETFTYGDPTPNKRNQLVKLHPGDLLVFYAGLEEKNSFDIPKLFIIGYFIVKNVYDFNKILKTEHASILKKVSNNAHAKRRYIDKGLVIIKGELNKSKLFLKALPLGDNRNCILRDLVTITGYNGSILRAIGHWIDEENAQKLEKWLKFGVSTLIKDNTQLFSYVLFSDTGFAPNVNGGYCTLACCKPNIRKEGQVGDWVVGTLPKHIGSDRIGYLMRINETATFNEFFNDKRFKNKNPFIDPNGDNIYYKKNNKFVQVKNNHHQEKDISHDIKIDRVLISALFWYFGTKDTKIPSDFLSIIKKGRGHKKITDTVLIRRFVSWVSSNNHTGVLGSHRDKC